MNRQHEKTNHFEKRMTAVAKKQQELKQRIEIMQSRCRALLG